MPLPFNNEGVFTINNVKAGKVVAVASYVGYHQELLTIVPVANSNNKADLLTQSFHMMVMK